VEQVTTIGLDIAKHVFQAHGADAAGHVLFRKRITRRKLIALAPRRQTKSRANWWRTKGITRAPS